MELLGSGGPQSGPEELVGQSLGGFPGSRACGGSASEPRYRRGIELRCEGRFGSELNNGTRACQHYSENQKIGFDSSDYVCVYIK